MQWKPDERAGVGGGGDEVKQVLKRYCQRAKNSSSEFVFVKLQQVIGCDTAKDGHHQSKEKLHILSDLLCLVDASQPRRLDPPNSKTTPP